MTHRDMIGSITTLDSNPEGVTQWTGGAGVKISPSVSREVNFMLESASHDGFNGISVGKTIAGPHASLATLSRAIKGDYGHGGLEGIKPSLSKGMLALAARIDAEVKR